MDFGIHFNDFGILNMPCYSILQRHLFRFWPNPTSHIKNRFHLYRIPFDKYLKTLFQFCGYFGDAKICAPCDRRSDYHINLDVYGFVQI